MDLRCLKCINHFTDRSDIYATKCGHLFHCHCLMQSLDRFQKCPYCFKEQVKQDAVKIYIASTDVHQESPQKLKTKLNSLNVELKFKDQRIKTLKTETSKFKAVKKLLREELKKLKKDLEAKKGAIQFNQMAIDYHRRICKVKDKYKIEVAQLRAHLSTLQSLDTILNGAECEADEVLDNSIISDVALSSCVDRLVEDLDSSDKENERINIDLLNYENELANLEEELQSLQAERSSIIQNLISKDEDQDIFSHMKTNVCCLIKKQCYEDLAVIFSVTELTKRNDCDKSDSEIISDTNSSENILQSSLATPLSEILDPSPEKLSPSSSDLALQKKCEDLVKNACRNPMKYLTSGKVELLDSEDEELGAKVDRKAKKTVACVNKKFENRKYRKLAKKKNLSAEAGAVTKRFKPISELGNLNNSVFELMDNACKS